MKRIVSLALVVSMAVTLAGCEPLRKKFIRKKKEPVKMPRIYQVKKYEKKPTPELYKKHYAYWASWQSELVRVLGENRKKDKRCIEEIVGNLNDMRAILVAQKGDALQAHIDKLEKVKETIFDEDLTPVNRDHVKRTLEREERLIKKEFVYGKVKDYLKKSFDEDESR